MVKFKKKEKGVNFKTVTGETLKVVLEKREKIIKVTIINSTHLSVPRSVILLVIAILNLLSLVLHILSIQIILGVFILTLLELCRLFAVKIEENLVVVKYLGFQLTTKHITGIKTKFIPWEQVQTIFINEVIFNNKIVYVLTLITKDMDNKERLVPLFFNSLPRLECLKVIYKELKILQGKETYNKREE